MKKLKSLGFAVIYLLIPIVLQLTLSAMISFHIVAVRLLHGVEYDADKLEAWISSAQINMILIMLVNATIIVGVGIWYWYLRKVHQPVKEMCECAIEAILKKINGEKVPSQIVFPVELIERESTKK